MRPSLPWGDTDLGPEGTGLLVQHVITCLCRRPRSSMYMALQLSRAVMGQAVLCTHFVRETCLGSCST